MKRKILTSIQVALLAVAGTAMAIPVYQNIQFNQNQSRLIQEFVEDVSNADIKWMEIENKDITDSTFYTEDPFDAEGTVTYTDDRAEPIAVLNIDKLGEKMVIYDQIDEHSLAEGIALLNGTHYPTGGIGNTTVVTGHRGTAYASIFKHIDLMELGDTAEIDNGKEVLVYEAYKIEVVHPWETEKLGIVPNQDTLILLSCETPDLSKGLNTHRILVHMKRVPEKTRDSRTNEDAKNDQTKDNNKGKSKHNKNNQAKEKKPVVDRQRNIKLLIVGLIVVFGITARLIFVELVKK